MRILVTGASGFIGGAIAERELARGWSVVGAGRRRPPDFPAAALWRDYDLAWRELPGGFFDGVDVLVHAAMMRGDVETNVAAGKLLLEGARANGVERVVFLSSLAAHGDAVSSYGRQKYALERMYADAGALVLRPGLVLGAGGAFGAMCAYLRHRSAIPLVAGGRQPVQTVSLAELLDALDRGLDERLSGTYTVAEEQPVEYRALYAQLAALLGKRPLFVPVPMWAARAAVGAAAALGVRLPIDRDSLDGLQAMRPDYGPRLHPLRGPVRTFAENLAAEGEGWFARRAHA